MVDFRLLGPLEVSHQGEALAAGPPKQRTVLATLLMRANRQVGLEELVRELWDRPPSSAVANLRTYAANLRRLLSRATGDQEVLVRSGSGYRLRVDPARLDAYVFERLRKDARALDTEAAAEALDAARLLWRGRAVEDVSVGPALAAYQASLNRARAAVTEDLAEHWISLGRAAAAISLLYELIAGDPLRERTHQLLMSAHLRAGDAAAALDTFAKARAVLAEELGIEPGPALRDLHRAALRNETPVPVSSALPPAAASFAGRTEELRALDTLPVRIAVLTGMAGSGKTALALHWAHRVRSRYPDGQLYVDLGDGTKPLRSLLLALGVEPSRIPPDTAEATALYRGILADRRVLILLDDAADPCQVRPLLPGGPGCTVLVTSRRKLVGLVAGEGALHIGLPVLAAAESLMLLSATMGEARTAAVGEEVAELCGHLPLALRTAATCLSSYPPEYLRRLRSGERRLSALEVAGDELSSVRASFDRSLRSLPEAARRLLSILSLLPGSDTSAVAAGPGTGRLLASLADWHLIEEHRPGRYRLHDLVRLHAAERADTEAADRVVEQYLSTAAAAAELVWPNRIRLPGAPAEFTGGPAEAAVWLAEERGNLAASVRYAAERGLDSARCFFALLPVGADWPAAGEAALAAARDSEQLAAAHLGLAAIRTGQKRYPEAVDHGTQALTHARRIGWPDGQIAALGGLSAAHRLSGNPGQAARCLREADAIQAGSPAGVAALLGHHAALNRHRGRLSEAAVQYGEAVELHRSRGATVEEARALAQLAEIDHRLGDLDRAHRHLRRAARLGQSVPDQATEFHVLRMLAIVHRDAGDVYDAYKAARSAMRLAEEGGRRDDRAGVLILLATIDERTGWHQRAADRIRQVIELLGHSENLYIGCIGRA